MNQAFPRSIAPVVLLVAAAATAVVIQQQKDPAFDFITGNRPCLKIRSDRSWFPMDGTTFRSSWGAILIVTASKDGRTDTFAVDPLTEAASRRGY
jgi:hypothetical protein